MSANERRPGKAEAASDQRRPNLKSGSTLPEAADNLSHLQRRVVLEAVETATASFWERRARDLEAARPVPGEFHGRATREELSRRWRELTEAARACRARAELTLRGVDCPELDDVLDEMSGAA